MPNQNLPRKRGRPRKKHAGGRPLYDGKPESEILSKLREAFDFGGTDEIACLNAGISLSTFQRICTRNPKFRIEKELRKHNIKLRSLRVLNKSLDEDNKEFNARWIIEKNMPEFNKTKEKDDEMAKKMLDGLPTVLEIMKRIKKTNEEEESK